ncbi:hypothetical protein TNCV_2415911 [Trichonephila clavipes]|nr:hypothetical protein TNCV_2415911 [Trichonephila clavipes]
MIFGHSGPGKELPQENYGSTTHGLPLTEKTAVFTTWLGKRCHSKDHRRLENNMLRSPIKAIFLLVPVMQRRN